MIGDIPPDSVESSYRRARMIATGLLVAMACLFVASLVWEHNYPALGWIRAFAEAAMVGALADWYAVTALFRRPLGLPIPHTQIIPRNKDRIASRLGSLTQRQLLTPAAIGKLVESWRVPNEFTAVLLDKSRRQVLTQEAARLLERMVDASEDAAMQQFIRHLAMKMVRGVRVAPLLGQVLSGFLASPQRDRLLNDALKFVGEAVGAHREQLCGLIADKLPWSRVLNLVRLDEKVAAKLVDWFLSLLRDMRDDSADPFRQGLIDRLEGAAEWLMHSEEAIRREDAIKADLSNYDALQRFLDESWHSLKEWLLTDLRQDASDTRATLDALLSGLGETLKTDPDFLALLQRGLQSFVIDLAARHGDRVGELVTATVRDWSVMHMVETIEREVGTDLQFIRINGALVGGLVGVALYGLAIVIASL
jgi:uncharacterized membrane-anchored protein YjiN (DUF445 family)